MIIPIRNKIGNYDEWCILEFQGEIVGDLSGKELGKLEIKEDGRAEMEIGQHFLEGSVVELKSPFVLIDSSNSSSDNKEYEIKAIVKKKLLFKNRPKPLGLKRLRP
eukprot:gene7874-8513_t